MTRLGSTNLKELLNEATWTWTGSSGIEEVYKWVGEGTSRMEKTWID